MSYDFSIVDKEIQLPSPVLAIRFSFWKPQIFIKRDDLIHPMVSGNKWRKLKGMIEWASQNDINKWISFGGAFSNHILALSYAANWFGVELKCYIRGEKHFIENPTLKESRKLGTDIEFIPRHEYRTFIDSYENDHADTLIIPEGGSHPFSRIGLKEMMHELDRQVDLSAFHSLWVGCGTGGTIGGIYRVKPKDLTTYAVCAVKDKSIPERIKMIAGRNIDQSLHILYPKKSMGYRKLSDSSVHLMKNIYKESGVKLDPIYTIKVFEQVDQFIKKNRLGTADNLLIIHTGGLQGLAGYEFIHKQIIYT